MIRFICPHCSYDTVVKDKFAGTRAPCNECGVSVPVPEKTQAIDPRYRIARHLGSIDLTLKVCGYILFFMMLAACGYTCTYLPGQL